MESAWALVLGSEVRREWGADLEGRTCALRWMGEESVVRAF